jgi:hypothetical protein
MLIEQMTKGGSAQVVVLLQAARIELLNTLNEETKRTASKALGYETPA